MKKITSLLILIIISLGSFNVASSQELNYEFGGFLTPLSNLGQDFNKKGAIPIKFQLFNLDGTYANDAIASLKVNGADAVAHGNSNDGNIFRNIGNHGVYMFNLDTREIDGGLNFLVVTLDDGQQFSWSIR